MEFKVTKSIEINGKVYKRIEDVPPELRDAYKQGLAAAEKAQADLQSAFALQQSLGGAPEGGPSKKRLVWSVVLVAVALLAFWFLRNG